MDVRDVGSLADREEPEKPEKPENVFEGKRRDEVCLWHFGLNI